MKSLILTCAFTLCAINPYISPKRISVGVDRRIVDGCYSINFGEFKDYSYESQEEIMVIYGNSREVEGLLQPKRFGRVIVDNAYNELNYSGTILSNNNLALDYIQFQCMWVDDNNGGLMSSDEAIYGYIGNQQVYECYLTDDDTIHFYCFDCSIDLLDSEFPFLHESTYIGYSSINEGVDNISRKTANETNANVKLLTNNPNQFAILNGNKGVYLNNSAYIPSDYQDYRTIDYVAFHGLFVADEEIYQSIVFRYRALNNFKYMRYFGSGTDYYEEEEPVLLLDSVYFLGFSRTIERAPYDEIMTFWNSRSVFDTGGDITFTSQVVWNWQQIYGTGAQTQFIGSLTSKNDNEIIEFFSNISIRAISLPSTDVTQIVNVGGAEFNDVIRVRRNPTNASYTRLLSLISEPFSMEDVQGGNSGGLWDVFTLMRATLNTLVPLLSIMILPNITLGTLVFIPFFATMLLFIIHMFKR